MGQITQENLSPDLVTYNCLLHAYATAKPARIGKVEKLTDHLEKKMDPDNVTYTTLIAAYAHAETAETQKIHDTLKRMKERGLSVDSITYSCLIGAYICTTLSTTLSTWKPISSFSRPTPPQPMHSVNISPVHFPSPPTSLVTLAPSPPPSLPVPDAYQTAISWPGIAGIFCSCLAPLSVVGFCLLVNDQTPKILRLGLCKPPKQP